MAIRQKVRLLILFLILLTFPVTLNYFSVYLIIESAGQGVIAFAFFFWSLFAVTALFFGRAACGYICPLGAIQETKDRMVGKKLTKIKYLKLLKYVLSVAWVGAIIYAAILAGGYRQINLLYNTESGVSVDSAQGWITYWMIVLVILLPAFFIGKRGFCHYFCPWGVLNITATKIKNFFRWPSLNLKAASDKCKQCRTCDGNCPMSLEPSQMVKSGSMVNTECILCGTCVDNCPNGVIKYSWSRL
ncbi:4Fe-4S binding protein [Chloroflexota bacterium]